MFLGAAAYLGVWLDRVAYDLATSLTGYMALGGTVLMIVRWGLMSRSRK